MSTTTLPEHNTPEDNPFPSEDAGDLTNAGELQLESSATLEPDWTGPRCDQCSAPIKNKEMAVCQQCGWYASLGIFVEIDKDWEVQSGNVEGAEPKPKPSHLEVWLKLLPWYAWVVIGTIFVLLIESVVVRLVLAESAMRTTWSLTQLAIGALAFLICHVVNYVVLASDDSDIGLLDIILRPLRIWMYSARELPRKLFLFDSGVSGLAAAAMSMLIIGGLPYEKLLDWGFKEPPKQNLMAAVMEQATKVKGKDMSMEEAIEEFAGKADVEDLQADEEPEPMPRWRSDCVIIGYRSYKGQGKVHTLILAAEHKGKLAYAGPVRPQLTNEEMLELVQALIMIKTKRPFIPLNGVEASWVKPVITCRVNFKEQLKDGRLVDIQWEKILGSIGFHKKKKK